MRIPFPKIAIGLSALLFLSSPAQAETGIASTGLNVRAGPGPGYPIVGHIPQGSQVDILGCVSGWKWCDVQTGGSGLFGLFGGGGGGGRGWVAGNYLNGYHNNTYSPVSGIGSLLGLSTLSFNEPDYWGQNYSDRPFYRQRYYNTRHWNENARLRGRLQDERAQDRQQDRREDAREAQQQQRAAQQQKRAVKKQKHVEKREAKQEKREDRRENRRDRND